MKEKEFQSHRKFKVRRKQFRDLDEMQMKLLDKKVPCGTTTYYEGHKQKDTNGIPVSENAGTHQDDESAVDHEESEDEEDDDHFDPDLPPFSFLTELKQHQQSLKGTASSNQSNATDSRLVNEKGNSEQSGRTSPTSAQPSRSSSPPPMLIVRKGAKLTEENLEAFMKQLEDGAKANTKGIEVELTNDHKYYHNYEHQLRGIIKQNANVCDQHNLIIYN
jgi:hypothetical protein